MGKHSNINKASPVETAFVWPDIPAETAISPQLRGVLPEHAGSFDFPFADQTLTIKGPLVAANAELKFCTMLDIDGTELMLWTDTDPLGFALRAHKYNAGKARYPSDTAPLVLEHLARSLLDRFAGAFEADKVVITGLRYATYDQADDQILMSMTNDTGDTHKFALSGSTATLVRLAALFGAPPEQRRKVSRGNVPVSCAVMGQDFEAGSADLAALRPEDVLVLDAAWFDETELTLHVSGHAMARVSNDNGRMRLMTNIHPLKRSYDMAFANPSLEDLPVTVSIELARKDIVFSELDKLSVGDVLSFAEDDLHAVKLTANGAVLGNGVLVKVDDQIAIRLTDVA